MKQNSTETSVQTIGRNIRRWRQLREMKGDELAHFIGINKASLSNIENGKTDLNLCKLEEIAKALDLTVHQLMFSDPQSIVTLAQNPHSNGLNSGTHNKSVDEALLEDLRQQLKIKDEQIKFLQGQFPTK